MQRTTDPRLASGSTRCIVPFRADAYIDEVRFDTLLGLPFEMAVTAVLILAFALAAHNLSDHERTFSAPG